MHEKFDGLGRFADPSLLILTSLADGRRRPYELTGPGRAVLAEQLASMARIAAVGQRRIAPA